MDLKIQYTLKEYGWPKPEYGGGELYSSGQVAQMLHVAPRTATSLCDSGDIESHKVPGSLDRRVEPKDLITYFQGQDPPIPMRLPTIPKEAIFKSSKACKLLGISSKSISKLEATNALEWYLIGDHRHYTAEGVAKYLVSQGETNLPEELTSVLPDEFIDSLMRSAPGTNISKILMQANNRPGQSRQPS